MKMAIRKRNLELIKYLHGSGVKITGSMIALATKDGNNELLSYLQKNMDTHLSKEELKDALGEAGFNLVETLYHNNAMSAIVT